MSTLDFEQQLAALQEGLLSFAFKLTKDRTEAEHLYQKMVQRALASNVQRKTTAQIKPWLFTLLRNLFVAQRRKTTKVTPNLAQQACDPSVKLLRPVGFTTETPTEFQAFVETLDRATQAPFLLHYYGYPYQEIADHLRLPIALVKSRVFWARAALEEATSKKSNGVLVPAA